MLHLLGAIEYLRQALVNTPGRVNRITVGDWSDALLEKAEVFHYVHIRPSGVQPLGGALTSYTFEIWVYGKIDTKTSIEAESTLNGIMPTDNSVFVLHDTLLSLQLAVAWLEKRENSGHNVSDVKCSQATERIHEGVHALGGYTMSITFNMRSAKAIDGSC